MYAGNAASEIDGAWSSRAASTAFVPGGCGDAATGSALRHDGPARRLPASGSDYPVPVFKPEAGAMAMNRVQFQPGLSMPESSGQSGSEAQCEQALATTRCHNGSCCPHHRALSCLIRCLAPHLAHTSRTSLPGSPEYLAGHYLPPSPHRPQYQRR